MTYAAALDLLAARQETRIRLGLARLRRSLRRLGNPQAAWPCLHVAGTNGKGSTCAILESVLRAAGYRTGLYLSPHLGCVRERIQVNGRAVCEADFARLLGRVLAADPAAELTYFELLTAVAFLYFREQGTQAVVLETGLGGRLDATNVVGKPVACVITSISHDHTQWLGRSLPRIAAEKAGIIKAGVPVFCAALPPAALRVMTRRAAALRAPLTVVKRAWPSVFVNWRANRQVLRDGRTRYELSLLGSRQGRNAALARAVLDGVRSTWPVPRAAWSRGLCRVRLPGRFMVLRRGGRTAIVDGAHNPEAMGELARTLGASPWNGRRLRWIFGIMRDKDCRSVVSRVAPRLHDVVAVAAPNPRAFPAGALAAELRRQAPRAAVRTVADAASALRQWRTDPAAPRTALVCGSFYLAAEAIAALRRCGYG